MLIHKFAVVDICLSNDCNNHVIPESFQLGIEINKNLLREHGVSTN